MTLTQNVPLTIGEHAEALFIALAKPKAGQI